jgi:chaperonin GroEL
MKTQSENSARARILSGVNKLAHTVRITLGPKGRNVLIDRNGTPLITNDGVTIARAFTAADPIENLAATVIKQASIKTNETAGDGTTSAIILAAEIMNKANRHITLGVSPVLIKEGLLTASQIASDAVKKIAKPANRYSDMLAVATNSCANQNDGELVARAFEKVGTDGVITLDENSNGKTTLTFVEGFECNCILASPYFCTDVERMESKLNNAKVLVTDQSVNRFADIVPVLEETKNENKPIILIAPDYTPEVISTLVLNRVRNNLNVIALKIDEAPDRASAILGDIAALTCSTPISQSNDLTLASATSEHLGMATTVIASTTSTKIIIDNNDNPHLTKRLTQIRGQINSATDDYTKVRLTQRLARLTSGVAIISVGCPTQAEQSERKLRIEDAIAATRSAATSGIVAGGGIAYLAAAKVLEQAIPTIQKHLHDGVEILRASLPCILVNICQNADISYEVVLNEINHTKNSPSFGGGREADGVVRVNIGYNALTNEYTDMFAAKIIDPALVICSVIQNAVSVAATLLTTEIAITAQTCSD